MFYQICFNLNRNKILLSYTEINAQKNNKRNKLLSNHIEDNTIEVCIL